MQIIHYFNENNRLAKKIKDKANFLLTNKLGGYLWLPGSPMSRYQGWFFTPSDMAGQKIFRVVENIEIENSQPVEEIRNNFWNIERKRGTIAERFFLPPFRDALVYETSKPVNLKIILDIKESYNNSQEDRSYEIFEENGLIMARYSQPGLGVPEIWLAIKSESETRQIIKQWILRNYAFDKNRNSPPFERYVFEALRLPASRIVIFSASQDKEKAVSQVQYVADNLEYLKKTAQKETKKLLPLFNQPSFSSPELKMAYLCARNALQGLLVFDENKKIKGLYAGLPWFFQFWQRDSALCLKALALINKSASQAIFEKMLFGIIKGERINANIDGWGWLLRQANNFSFKRKLLLAVIEEFIKAGREHSPDDGQCFFHHPRATWMDSIDRATCAVEIQSLLLNAYRLASAQYEFWGKKFFYDNQEKDGRQYLKDNLWNGEELADGLHDNQTADFTIRPNVFLAALAYPKLLTRTEWQKCFENILPKLWLSWGGLATLDKQNRNFRTEHTGELSLSYHQGDSWFFLNNLAGLMLVEINKKKFMPYIEKIIKASAHDILWQGIVGHHSELSSAKNLQAEGCLSQAWSAAFYLELLKKLY